MTHILSRIEQGEPAAAAQLLPLVYAELRRLAAAKLAQEKPGQTLQAAALVHEAYLRLVDVEKAQRWNSRGHFFGAAAEAMRRILIESARRRQSSKRGAGRQQRDLIDLTICANPRVDDLLDLEEALGNLAQVDPCAAKPVELRVFAGMSIEDVALLLGVSPRTAKRTWAYARAWLRRQVGLECDSNSSAAET